MHLCRLNNAFEINEFCLYAFVISVKLVVSNNTLVDLHAELSWRHLPTRHTDIFTLLFSETFRSFLEESCGKSAAKVGLMENTAYCQTEIIENARNFCRI